MSLYNAKRKIKKELLMQKQNTAKNIIKSPLSTKEIVKNHSNSDLFIKNPKYKLDYKAINRPRYPPVKRINTNEMKKFINKYKKITFYNVNKSRDFVKEGIKPFLDSGNFSKKYKIFKNRTKDLLGEKEMLEDIQNKLYKNNLKIPLIEGDNKNLFKHNLLLTKDKNITYFINHHLGTSKSDIKSITYINKVDKVLSNKIEGNYINMNQINNEISQNSTWIKKFYNDEEKIDKIQTNIEISKSQNDINNTQNTIKNLKNIDNFFEVDNKKYLKLLKRKIIKKETKANSLDLENTKNFHNTILYFPNSNINKIEKINNGKKEEKTILKNKIIKLKIKTKNEYNKNNIIHNNIYITKKKIKNNIIKLNNKSNINTLIFIPNIKKNDNNEIKIKKLNLGRKQSQQLRESLKSQDLNNITMSTLHPNNSYDKIFNTNSKLNVEGTPTPKFKNKIISLDNNENLSKEELYDKIKNNDYYMPYNNLIQNYCKDKKCEINSKFNINEVVNSYMTMKNNVCENDFVKRNIKLKKNSYIGLDSTDKLNEYLYRTNLKMKNMKDEINHIFTNLSTSIHMNKNT